MLRTTHQQMLRVLMKGKACQKGYEGGQRTYSLISYIEVCRALEMPTIDVVLRTSRLKFLQTLSAKPQHHQLVWCCLIGKYEFEEELTDNPWARLYCSDIIELEEFDGVYEVSEAIKDKFRTMGGRALKLLLVDSRLREIFVQFDISQIKRKKHFGWPQYQFSL